MPFRLFFTIAAFVSSITASSAADRPPNVVVIFCDDMGYADIGPFGSKTATPHLDRMADEGRCFTDFYAAQAVCSASRAALLTGCYPNRVGILGALGPQAKHGLNPEETTIAELLKSKGYATAVYGKWHLGDEEPFLPTNHGFDEYFGLPYSNDMWPLHPELVKLAPEASERKSRYPDLPLWEGDANGHRIADPKVTAEDQAKLTTSYTERAVAFIDEHRDEPFFVYVPHSMVHVPIFASDKFAGKSGHGLFGDVIQEIDWSVGQILEAIRRHKLAENTLVVFTSDNGPWLSYGDHAGSAGPLREGKGTTWEGGQREPTLFWWPGTIPAGTTCDEVCGTIDLLPTIAALAGAKLPERTIDGKNIAPLLRGDEGAKSPHEAFFYYWGHELQAVRSGKWKLHFPHSYRSLDGKPGGTGGTPSNYVTKRTDLALYDLATDVGETTNVSGEHPEIVSRLTQLADDMRDDLGDSATKQQGAGRRPAGRVDD
ncbi:MAG: sulfatase [Planctomycetaceae bacterium]